MLGAGLAWYQGVQTLSGRLALLLAAGLVGVLLAVFIAFTMRPEEPLVYVMLGIVLIIGAFALYASTELNTFMVQRCCLPWHRVIPAP